MDKCPFCGAEKTWELNHPTGINQNFACETARRGEIWIRGEPCYETEIVALKKLVREMGDVVDRFGIVVLRPQLRSILNRPEVRAILEEKP